VRVQATKTQTTFGVMLLTLALSCALGAGPARAAASDLQVSSNGHYLTEADDTPFFFLSDTEWILTLMC